jgi:hypothetical protein
MKNCYQPKTDRNARQISRFEAWFIHRKGLHDGSLGLQRQDEAGEWTSPYIQRELAAYRELTKREWLQCEIETTELQIQAEKLKQKIIRMKSKCRNISSNLDVRYAGEEALDSCIVHGRRGKELIVLEQLEDNHQEIMQKIFETENAVRLNCMRVKDHTYGRISIYWNACLESNPDAKNLPPMPQSIHSDAESAYMLHHGRNVLPTNIADQITEEEDNYA